MGKREITKNTIVFFLGTLSSRILGFIRDILIAKYFGTTFTSDAFFVAFRIPNLFRRLIGEGALSAAFIPVFSEYEAKGEDINKIANSALISLFIFLALLLLFGESFTTLLVNIVAPGFKKNAHIYRLTVQLTKITFPYIFFMGMAILIGATLNYRRDFFYTSVSPVLLNISLIIAIFMRNNFKQPIFSLAWGVFIGGILQITFHFLGAYKLKTLSFKLTLPFSEPVKEALKLMMPATAGLAIHQINTFVDTVIASFLPMGSISYLYYANRLFQLPLALFGIGVGSVLLPVVSEAITHNNSEEVVENVKYSIGLATLVNIPATMGLIVFSKEIIDLLFKRGVFTSESVTNTAYALSMYAIGLSIISINKIIVSLYHGHKDMKTPVKASLLALIANIILNIILVFPLKHAGLALATSLSSFIQLYYLLNNVKDKGYKPFELFPSHLKKLLILNLFLLALMTTLKIAVPYDFQASFLFKALHIIFYIGVTLGAFWLVARSINVPEIKILENTIIKR